MDQRFYSDRGNGQYSDPNFDGRRAYGVPSGGYGMAYPQNNWGQSDRDRQNYGRDYMQNPIRSDFRQTPANPPQSSYGYGGSASGGGVVIYTPTTYRDIQIIIDQLKLNQQVIVDFSTVKQDAVYRSLDFMSGAIYALGGSIKQISQDIFLFAPAGVTITIPPQLSRR